MFQILILIKSDIIEKAVGQIRLELRKGHWIYSDVVSTYRWITVNTQFPICFQQFAAAKERVDASANEKLLYILRQTEHEFSSNIRSHSVETAIMSRCEDIVFRAMDVKSLQTSYLPQLYDHDHDSICENQALQICAGKFC